jgi:thymidylate kinase
VKVRHLKPQILIPRRGEPGAIVVDPHGKPPRSALTSVAKLWVWLMEEWCAAIFEDERKTILICDRYYHDLLVDPVRYRYGGPMWAARVLGKLMPRVSLWILLDAPVEILQSRKQEVSLDETARQRQAYLAFVRQQDRHVIADASQPLDRVIGEVEQAVTAMGGFKALGENR